MEIQGTCPYPDKQLTRPWFRAILLDQLETFQASRGLQPNLSHGKLLPTAQGFMRPTSRVDALTALNTGIGDRSTRIAAAKLLLVMTFFSWVVVAIGTLVPRQRTGELQNCRESLRGGVVQ
ncbi:hypothetical protein MES5069_10084 [Mesorhizobium escarrei]|uniref:Uncharacterized protein n=1 Tax=Mesorhizobium escarrei TaxID=666018 RepID=A0ABN8JA37_9HYPH|nr:hypothetical protein MES5069_10084 [Mesorhizobium escarrei]